MREPAKCVDRRVVRQVDDDLVPSRPTVIERWRRRGDWVYDGQATSTDRELVIRRIRNPTSTRGLDELQAQGIGPMDLCRPIDADSWMVVASVAGRPLGSAYAIRFLVDDSEALIDDVVVATLARRHRIGSLIVSDLMDWLTESGFARINLCPKEGWQSAWYRSLGFTVEDGYSSMIAVSDSTRPRVQ